MAEISPKDIIQRRQSLVIQEIDGDVVILNLDSGEYYGLAEVGVEIWKRIEQPQNVQSLIDSLIADFEGDAEVIQADVLEFLNNMQEEGIIEQADS